MTLLALLSKFIIVFVLVARDAIARRFGILTIFMTVFARHSGVHAVQWKRMFESSGQWNRAGIERAVKQLQLRRLDS